MTDQSIHQDEEFWKPVVGWEDRYLVSDYGRIYSILANRPLKLKYTHKGYISTWLQKDGVKKYLEVHRIVAECFLGSPNGRHVNHKDSDRTNNKLSNLEFVTARENICHGMISRNGSVGVSYIKSRDKWMAYIFINGSKIFLGNFRTKPEALDAYQAATIKYGIINKYHSVTAI